MSTSGQTITLDQEAGSRLAGSLVLSQTKLMQVELEFERQARSNVQVINYLGEYLRLSGGKACVRADDTCEVRQSAATARVTTPSAWPP